MLTLAEAKTYLRLSPLGTDPVEDAEVQGFLTTAAGMFRTESKRRWPADNEPTVSAVVMVLPDLVLDPLGVVTTKVVTKYRDPAVLDADEQLTAGQWLRFTLGHLYENRQTVAVGLNMTEVPHTAKMLMNLLREPTL